MMQEALSRGEIGESLCGPTQKLVAAIAGYKSAATSVKSLLPKAKAAGKAKGKAKAQACSKHRCRLKAKRKHGLA